MKETNPIVGRWAEKKPSNKKKYFILLSDWWIPNKRQVLLSLTESASCLMSCNEQCCYRTVGLMSKDTAIASVDL